MKIIRKDPNQSGAYPPFQGWHSETPPDGYAVLPDGIDTADFYAYNGFVSLEIEAIEHTHKVEKMVEVERTRPVEKTREVEETIVNDDGEKETVVVVKKYTEDEPYTAYETQTVDEPYTIDTVIAITPNVEAWEAWKASQPEPECEPRTPSLQDDLAAMTVDHEYRITLLELGL